VGAAVVVVGAAVVVVGAAVVVVGAAVVVVGAAVVVVGAAVVVVVGRSRVRDVEAQEATNRIPRVSGARRRFGTGQVFQTGA